MSPISSTPPQVKPKLSGPSGFSLVEVVIAIGVVAFALISIIGVLGISLKAHGDSSVDSVFSVMTETAMQEVRNDNTSLVPLAAGAYNFNAKFGAYTGYLYFDEDGQITKDAARTASSTASPTSSSTPSSTIQSTEMGVDVSQPAFFNPANAGNQGVPLPAKATTGLPATTYYTCTITTLPAKNSTGAASTSMYLVKLTFTWPGNATGRVIFSSISNNTN